MTSAFSASFMKIAWPSGLLRLSVIAFLLRCKFWKSKPWRVLPVASLPPADGASILITSAPQSASWRTAVGPARCAVRSITRMWERGRSVMVDSSLLIFYGPRASRALMRRAGRARSGRRLTSFENRFAFLHESPAAFLVVVAVEAGFGQFGQPLVILPGLGLGDLAR